MLGLMYAMPARRRLLLALDFITLLLMLTACGSTPEQVEPGRGPAALATRPSASAVRGIPAPATLLGTSVTPTLYSAAVSRGDAATATPAVDGWIGECITGTITEVKPRGHSVTILVDEYPKDPTEGDRLLVSVPGAARILQRTAGRPLHRESDDLRVGRRVTVVCAGPIATSYPGRAKAHEVAILRTHTDGPSEGRWASTVTKTFRLSLYNLGGEVPAGDDFYASYSIRGGRGGELHFCGDDAGAPERCRGFGGTYELAVEVPRGAELGYSVRRLAVSGKLEVLDRGREVLDADMVNTSHYRYGAANPDGFDG